MKQSFNLYRCKIKILPLLVFICLLALLIRLGFWQLSRAVEKREFLTNQQEKLRGEILPVNEVLASDRDYRYRRVIMDGHYDVKHQFLMDNQFHKGKLGYYVMTPFILAAGGQTVLINRGWVLMNKDRKQLPDIDFTPAAEKLSIVGVINQFPQLGLVLEGADDPSDGWPSVVQVINAQKIKVKMNQPIVDFQVQLSADQHYGYIREWQIKPRIPPEKHTAYAFQWFALAITLTLLALWVSCKTENND